MNRRSFTKNIVISSAMFSSSFGLGFSGLVNSDEKSEPLLKFKPLFNGKNLNGFIDVNTSQKTWYVEDGILKCTGMPIGVMRTERQYENFILDIEWRHMEPGGNSGVFVWADGEPFEDRPFPTGMEVQMLDPDYITKVRPDRTSEWVHGHLFPVMGLRGKTIADNPSEAAPGRSYSLEERVKGNRQWNRYTVVCVDGTLKLSVNGKFVNGIRSPKRKKGYICPEAEGQEIHFRRMDIMELPPGVITPEQIAPVVKNKDSKRFL